VQRKRQEIRTRASQAVANQAVANQATAASDVNAMLPVAKVEDLDGAPYAITPPDDSSYMAHGHEVGSWVGDLSTAPAAAAAAGSADGADSAGVDYTVADRSAGDDESCIPGAPSLPPSPPSPPPPPPIDSPTLVNDSPALMKRASGRARTKGGRLNVISSLVDSIADGLEDDAEEAQGDEGKPLEHHHEALDTWSQEALHGSIATVRQKLTTREEAESAEAREARSLRELQMVATTLRAVLARRQEELGWRPPHVYNTRVALAWLFNFGILIVACFFSIIYALKFQEQATRNMCMAWLIAYGVTFAIVEPVQVCAIACLPSLSDEDTRCGRFCGRCRFMYNELCAP